MKPAPDPMQPRRIAFVVGRYGLDGVSRWLHHLIVNLDRNRWQPILLLLETPPPDERLGGMLLKDLNCEVRVSRYGRGLRDPRRVLHLLWQARSLNAALIVSSNRQLDSLLRPLCKAAGTVHLSVHHSTYPDYTRFVRLLERLTLHLSDEAVAVSQAVADSYRPLGRSLGVILHGVQRPEPGKPPGAIRLALGIPERECVFLCVGRLNGIHKNQEQLIRGFRRFADAGGNGALILLGPGPEQARLEMLIQKLGLARRVFLIPGDADVGSYLQDASIYVQPSTYEGFGLTLVEAMSHALPMVATRLPAFEEILRGCPVFWIDGFNDAAIAAALSHAAATAPERRKEMGRAVHARYREAFSVATMVDQYETLFERLLAA